MRPSPAILVTTPTTPCKDKDIEKFELRLELKEEENYETPKKVSSASERPRDRSPGSRMSFLNVEAGGGDSHRRSPHQRGGGGGGIAAIRRHTVMLARDVLLRRFSRNDGGISPLRERLTLEEFEKLVHEVNQMVAAYRQILQTIGTHSESGHTRKELSSCRRQCLRTCESAKDCILPLLKSDTDDQEGFSQNSDLAKHASHQFIGCLNMFILEMKRTQSLLRAVPPPGSAASRMSRESVTDGSSYCTAGGSSIDLRMDDELECLARDLKEAELMLETLENAITVHFSMEPSRLAESPFSVPKTKKNGRQFGKFCLYFKTNYA